jgi:cytochrome o ubiquinol oxidase subunit IV
MQKAVTLRAIGFFFSMLLSLVAFSVIIYPEFFQLDTRLAIITILCLALAQAIVQLLFFLNVWHEKGTLWNLTVFFSTVAIIFIVIFFSMWIMEHLNYNMMPR